MRLSVALLALLGCTGSNIDSRDNTDSGLQEEIDETPPVIVHEPIEGTQTHGVDVPITATITDADSGVLFAYLYYKNEIGGDADWKRKVMVASGEVYSASIDGDDMNGGGVDYYIEAVDKAQNTAWAPEDGRDDPYHFRLSE